MKRSFLILLSLIFTISLCAQSLIFTKSDMFIIKEMNIDFINIDGKPLKEGDTFRYGQKITWSGTLGDRIETQWVGHDKYFRFEYNKNLGNGRPAIDYIKTNKTLHKGSSSARNVLSDTFFSTGRPIYIEVGEAVNSNHYFIFRYKGQKYQIPFVEEHILCFNPSDYPFVYDDDGIIKLRVSYIILDDNGKTTEESVTSNMIISRIITR